jgi:hypothetical protein
MHRYRVAEIGSAGRSISLQDSSGKYHLARAVADVPEVGTNLLGPLPGLGFRVLHCRATERAYRLTFEAIDRAAPAKALAATSYDAGSAALQAYRQSGLPPRAAGAGGAGSALSSQGTHDHADTSTEP